MKKILLLLAVVTGTLTQTACPRYDAVRKLSTEELKVQQAFQVQLTKYFASMEEFADNHVTVSQLYYDDLLNGIPGDEPRLRRRADRDIAAIKANTTTTPDEKISAIAARSQELGRQLEILRSKNEADKAEMVATIREYKAKNQEILATYQTILDAQAELDRYIQLKKFDEVITEQLLGKIHVNQAKALGLFDKASSLADKLKFKAPAPAAVNP